MSTDANISARAAVVATPAADKTDGTDRIDTHAGSGTTLAAQGSGESKTPRPPEAKTDLLRIRIHPELKARLVIHAQSRGEEFSAWVRRALRVQADREATDRVAGPLFLDATDVQALSKPSADGLHQCGKCGDYYRDGIDGNAAKTLCRKCILTLEATR